MARLTIAGLFLLSVVPLGWSYFNCEKQGCNAGTCDYFGNCNCQTGFQGYNCGLDSALITKDADCTVKCLNKGICYATNKCYCTEDFSGPTCGDPLEMVYCKKESMHMTVYRPDSFMGEMFLKQSMKHCVMKIVDPTDRPGFNKYQLDVKLKHSGPCQLDRTYNATTEDVVYVADVITTNKEGTYGMSDITTKMNCSYPGMKLGSSTDISTSPEMIPTKFEVYADTSLDHRSHHIRNGMELVIAISLKDQTDTRSLAVTYLEAFYINENTNKPVSVVIIDKECPTFGIEEVIHQYPKQETKVINNIKYSLVELRSWVEGPSKLYFNYRVRFCTQECKTPPPNCDVLTQSQPIPVVKNTNFVPTF